MTKFNPENKDILTYGDCLKPAMEITGKPTAEQAFNAGLQKGIASRKLSTN